MLQGVVRQENMFQHTTPLVWEAGVMPLLHRAAESPDISELTRWLDEGADINARNDQEETPLHRAVFRYNLPAVKLLTARGADVCLFDRRGYSPVRWATSWYGADRDMDMIRVLLDAFPLDKPDALGETRVHFEAWCGFADKVKQLVREAPARATIMNNLGNTPADYAQDGGFFELAEWLSPSQPPVGGRRVNATIHQETMAKYCNAVAMLDPIADSVKIESYAAFRDSDGSSLLHWAVFLGNIRAVMALTAVGMDINVFNQYGHSCFDWIPTECVEPAIINILLSHFKMGADGHGRTHLHFSAWFQSMDLSLLVARSGGGGTEDKKGFLPEDYERLSPVAMNMPARRVSWHGASSAMTTPGSAEWSSASSTSPTSRSRSASEGDLSKKPAWA